MESQNTIMMLMIVSIWMFYILQWNARTLLANGQELKRFVDEFKDKPEIISIQETWLKPCLDFVIPGYECLREDRQDRAGGGCAMFIKSGIQYRRVEVVSAIECVIAEVWCSKGRISLVNTYNPCQRLSVADLDQIMDKVREPVIWVGDFNSHNPLWGSSNRDANGAVIEEFLDKHRLSVLNDGRATRFTNKGHN